MTRTLARTVVATTALGAALIGAAGSVTTGAAQAAPHDSQTTAAAAAAATGTAARPRTRVTFTVQGCTSGCTLQLHSATVHHQSVWHSDVEPIADGAVTFEVPTRRTVDLSASLHAPYERNLDFVPQVVFRYPGEPVGTVVTRAASASYDRAAGCWAGTAEPTVVLPLVVRRVTIPGIGGRQGIAPRAWVGVSQPAEGPRFRASGGVLGAQDVPFCRPSA